MVWSEAVGSSQGGRASSHFQAVRRQTMTTAPVEGPSIVRLRLSCRQVRQAGGGFLFWLAFVLMLEPGNVMRALHAGAPVIAANEALRMACAATLGAAITPLVLWLGRRLSVRGPRGLRNLAVLAAALAGLALTLLMAAGLIAPLLPPSTVRGGLGEMVAGNFLLLMAALAVLVAWAQITGRPAASEAGAYVDRIAARGRGGVVLVDVAEIDWIEAQGNYLALHVGQKVHLVRETMAVMQRRLDPERFARVHRGSIVNLDRIRQIRPLDSGDANLELASGETVRLSRTYGEVVRPKLALSG
jgi:two-component system LytT family response regulator